MRLNCIVFESHKNNIKKFPLLLLAATIDFVLVRCFKSNKNEINKRRDLINLYFISVCILTVFHLKNSAFLLQIAQMFDHH